ncbi:protein adenylyltransferase SelO [Methylobacterium sp. ID0610]|uniref:protein adenylyltransferase SelO n=1 Tax=Methylobacterium carpenticola TaxID=3344827 RepID=UPI0036B0192D
MTAIPFDNSYARMPERFFARTDPSPVSAPRLIRLNRDLARSLGLDPDWLAGPEGLAILAGNRIAAGSAPIATAYAGHQFGHLVPQLGDGRAILLGEVIDRDGIRRDIQLKGSGPTPFSRRGDGRAALGPVLREYVVSEAMAALGIPTTRALAAVTTGERVIRETLLPGAILTRVASSHIRVGTFQFFAIRGDTEGVRHLADHVIARHYPEIAGEAQPYAALLSAVIARQAALVAQWLGVGFIHGVMNTDNMSVAGETIDYGPCAFLDAYDPGTVFSAIDEQGRYAYGNQPMIAQWNLVRLAETLVPLLADGTEAAIRIAEERLAAFGPLFESAYLAGLRRKLGLFTERAEDRALAGALLTAMTENQADFTLTFRHLGAAAADPVQDGPVRDRFIDPTAYDAWAMRWRERLAAEPQGAEERRRAMDRANPAFIPRNHRIEAVIEAAVERDDFAPFAELLTVLSAPYEDQPAFARYAEPPEAHERVHRTFCGT